METLLALAVLEETFVGWCHAAQRADYLRRNMAYISGNVHKCQALFSDETCVEALFVLWSWEEQSETYETGLSQGGG